ncbi:addiction module protein [Rhodohalobacter sp.]|uniref:addiction module protein n=1 Tax=Rhodohalobacter sp. TaxID=1974210 RepID=UPI002ACE520F|nr:addiction module protein [Rhodohalobacter sp.]MDZ7758214.1 addiction module protein [Rhodohalobacter sp.]
MIKEKIPELKKLSDDEKIILIGELWDEVMTEESFSLTKEQKKELDKRINYAEENPDELIPWDEVKEKLYAKYTV